MIVVCVKWGSKYPADWVRKLRHMVQRHLAAEHEFHCLTDLPFDDVYCRPLGSDLPGWWAKLNLFRPGMFSGDVLYLDLDLVITGGLDGLVAQLEGDRTRLWARDDFSYSLRTPKGDIGPDTRRLLGGAGTINSSVMLWHGDACRRVWDDFDLGVIGELHGDQNWITRALWPDGIRFLPDDVVKSYKYHVLRGEVPGAITVFHGEPKPDQVRDAWVRAAWQ